MALAISPRVGISRACVRVVGAGLAFPVGLRVASTPARSLIIAAVLRPKALLARPCLNQRTVDREVFLRQQSAGLGHAHDLGKQAFHHLMRQQAVAILREGRVIPDRIIERQAHEPAKQQVVTQLLAQLPFAADRVEHLQQQSPDQLLRRDRVAAAIGIDRVELGVHRCQRVVHQQPDRPQRMIRRYEVISFAIVNRLSCIASPPRIAVTPTPT